MIYNKKRVMKVPIKDDGTLKEMILEHKIVTKNALKFYRNRIRFVSKVDRLDERRHRIINKINCAVERKITKDSTLMGLGTKHLTAWSTVWAPINEFMKRGGNRKRTPRFRRMDLRLASHEVRIHLDAVTPSVEIGFRKSTGRGVNFRSFTIKGSQRYFDRFRDMDQTCAYLSFKKGRVWICFVFSQEVHCIIPQTFLGLDAGMHGNKNVWYPALVDRDGTILSDVAPNPVKADVDPQSAARHLIDLAKEHNACITIENLTSLGRNQAGKSNKLSLGEYRNALVIACEDNVVPLVKINPKHTSQRCHQCDYVSRKNRIKTLFNCQECEFEGHADENAAINIARLGPAKYNEETK